MILRDVEVDGVTGLDVRLDGGAIVEIGPGLARCSDREVLDGQGGALLPGLHDHHLHLRAMAAVERSVRCGLPEVADGAALANALRRAADGLRPDEWVRGTGFEESEVGYLDRCRLDAMVADRPVKVQHRSGHLWVLNTAGLALLGLDHGPAADGRLYDQDHLLRVPVDRPEHRDPSAARRVSGHLARAGVVGFTDATAGNGPSEAAAFASMIEADAIRQKVLLLGDENLRVPELPRLRRGARKVMLLEHDVADLDELVSTIVGSHRAGRPVAIHAASREMLVLALVALDAAGTVRGDRVEHASVAPPETVEWMARLGVAVVTQHGFVAAHGDRYLDQVEPGDQPWLYRGLGFIAGGVRLAGGTDAPFGPDDPWAAMRAAVDRRTARGMTVGIDEAMTPEAALAMFTCPATDPGGPPRRVSAGASADLCLLALPWAEARDHLTADLVAATIIDGDIAFRASGSGW